MTHRFGDKETRGQGDKVPDRVVNPPCHPVTLSPCPAATFRPLLLLSLALLPLTGCGKNDPPAFRLNMMQAVANNISRDHQQDIANILDAMFGSPDKPFAMEQTGLDITKLKMAAGPVGGIGPGGKYGLYRRHCAHCHGISGDGRGPTAAILNPYPRDYRPGKYKFKSTVLAAEPTTEDLYRVIHDGVPGTAMPAFALLPPDEIAALTEYVKYLSMRGQMETAIVAYVADEGLAPDQRLDPVADANLKSILMDELTTITEAWQTAGEQMNIPEEVALPPADRTTEQIAESAAKGRDLFFSAAKGNCMLCHGPTALGDAQTTDYDDWSKANLEFINATNQLVEDIKDLKEDLKKPDVADSEATEQELDDKRRELALRQPIADHLLPPRNAIPRNLREGIYRGGRRPIDVFWRVKGGIRGTPMPEAPATLTQEEIWQIVDYVQSLPFEEINQAQTQPINEDAVN